MVLPSWIRQKAPAQDVLGHMKSLLDSLDLHTVCESAHCPNAVECFARGTATVLIMGDKCTRDCRFCAVEKGHPGPLNPEEPGNVAALARQLDLKHVVITSVTRDDLLDGGAAHFALTVAAVRASSPSATIEVLIPDFRGQQKAIDRVVSAAPDIINHNLETVEGLYQKVRPGADYRTSLLLLKKVKELDASILTKSGIMVGLGETKAEVLAVMDDLRQVSCDILTIGQYLQPSAEHLEVFEYIEPAVFNWYKEIGQAKGFRYVAAAPLVRSSYQAEVVFNR